MNKTIKHTLVSLFTLSVVVVGYGCTSVQARTIICPQDYYCQFDEGTLSSTDTVVQNDPQINELLKSATSFGSVLPASSTIIPSTYTQYVAPQSTVGGTASCPTFSQTLRLGNTGTAVSALQTWLMGKNYTIASIASGKNKPGYYGYETYNALGKYQKAVGLRVTGVLDAATMSKINSSCGGSVSMQTNTQVMVPIVSNQMTGGQTQAEKNAMIEAQIQAAVAKYRAAGGR